VTAELQSLMEAAHDAAELAGAVALKHYRTGVAVDLKGDGSPVTVADRSAEIAVREWIAARFPDDGILGEEFGEQIGRSGRRWILDPIDGTKSFVRGVPLWGSLVALVDGDRVLAGAACFAPVDETIAAAPGCGTWCNGVRAQVSSVTDLAAATVLITDDRTVGPPMSRAGWERLSRRASVSRSWGDCFGYLLVATGRAEVMVDPIVNPWDAACFQPIIEEAGGVFTDLNGVHTVFGGHAIATNAGVAAAARALISSTE
jgi:histidinol phosphatase-like enzyme (inositol monophosphatase family)